MDDIKNNFIVLRMDDVGAATKKNEVYSHIPLGNIFFLKYIKPFKKWGPYRELSYDEWMAILDFMAKHSLKLTLGITAAWVEDKDLLLPFPEKFPKQAQAIKKGVNGGIIEVANHGLTHCVLANNIFRPHLFSGNRKFHREFWDWIPFEIHEQHIAKAQKILQDYFGCPIVTFIPPGNVYQKNTIAIAKQYGIKYVSCNTKSRTEDGMVFIGDDLLYAFHDREIVFCGVNWLEKKVSSLNGKSMFVKELGKLMLEGNYAAV